MTTDRRTRHNAENYTVRIPHATRALLHAAAERRGVSLAAYIRDAAVEAARETLREDHRGS